MAVDDLWYLRKRDPNTGDRLPSKRHGRGKRWRVRWTDPETGKPRTELFDRKVDADRHDANQRADISRGHYINPDAGRITLADYAQMWQKSQLHRPSTADRCERALRRHIQPILGSLPLAQIRTSHIRGWIKDRAQVLAPSTLHMIYASTLVPLFNTAIVDRRIASSPCTGVRLPEIPDADYYIATQQEVHALYAALPERYRAMVYMAAGCGWRAGEIMGLETDAIDFLRRKVYVRQQLIYTTGRGLYLGPLKTKTSKRTNELPDITARALSKHLKQHPPTPVEIDDYTDTRQPHRRAAHLIFTNDKGLPIRHVDWSRIWTTAVKHVGLPTGFGLRDLRHYYATVLIFGGANVKTVQLAMGHAKPTITLNTYVGYWPDAPDQTRSLVNDILGCTLPVPRTDTTPIDAGHIHNTS